MIHRPTRVNAYHDIPKFCTHAEIMQHNAAQCSLQGIMVVNDHKNENEGISDKTWQNNPYKCSVEIKQRITNQERKPKT